MLKPHNIHFLAKMLFHQKDLVKKLFFSKEAVQQKAVEVGILFGPIASILDKHCALQPNMPDRQACALKIFRDELVELATKHFEAYVLDTTVFPTVSLKNSFI